MTAEPGFLWQNVSSVLCGKTPQIAGNEAFEACISMFWRMSAIKKGWRFAGVSEVSLCFLRANGMIVYNGNGMKAKGMIGLVVVAVLMLAGGYDRVKGYVERWTGGEFLPVAVEGQVWGSSPAAGARP